MLGSKPLSTILKCSFNYLTGNNFSLLQSKADLGVPKAREKPYCGLTREQKMRYMCF